jgi:hypothetical protein
MSCESIFTFVLNKESSHIMTINGVECVTLGHNFQEEVVRHSFFGTDLILNEMKKMIGWEEGLIELPNAETAFVRASKSNLVCGFSNNSNVLSPGC